MKTIAFYSYKGGVGRTLAVAHTAYWLGTQGKSVFMLDMDIEAPGLHYKTDQFFKPVTPVAGLIDYVGHFQRNNAADRSLDSYVLALESKFGKMPSAWLMPAGNPFQPAYWEQLGKVEWKEFLYGPDKIGTLLFLELKAQIQQTYQPDFLLIDSRTGLTDLTSIGLELLADDAIVLGVNNPENIDGARLVIERLGRRAKLSFREESTRIHYCLTRIPAPTTPKALQREAQIKDSVLSRLNQNAIGAGKLVASINVIHSDPGQSLGERNRFAEKDWSRYPILKDYQRLVFEVTGLGMESDGLSFWDLWEEFTVESANEKKHALALKLLKWSTNQVDQILQKGLLARNFLKEPNLAVEHFDQVIALRPDEVDGYFERGYTLLSMEDNRGALSDFQRALALRDFEWGAYFNIAVCYQRLGELDSALSSIQKSLEINPDVPLTHLLYAEVQSALGETEEFFHGLENAFSNDPSLLLDLAPQTIARHQDDPRFQALLGRYRPASPLNPSNSPG